MINVLRNKKELMKKIMIGLVSGIILSISAYMIYTFAMGGSGGTPQGPEHPLYIHTTFDEYKQTSMEDFAKPYYEYVMYDGNCYSIDDANPIITKEVIPFDEYFASHSSLKDSQDVKDYLEIYFGPTWENNLHYYGLTTYLIDVTGIPNIDEMDEVIHGLSIFEGANAKSYDDYDFESELDSLTKEDKIAIESLIEQDGFWYFKDSNTLAIIVNYNFKHEIDLTFDIEFTESDVQDQINNNSGVVDRTFLDKMFYSSIELSEDCGVSIDSSSNITLLGDHQYLLDLKLKFNYPNNYDMYIDSTLIGDIEFINNNSGYLLNDFMNITYPIYDNETDYENNTIVPWDIANGNRPDLDQEHRRKMYAKELIPGSSSELRFQRVIDFNDRKLQLEFNFPSDFNENIDWTNLSSTNYKSLITSNTGATISSAGIALSAEIFNRYENMDDNRAFLCITINTETNTQNGGVKENFNKVEYKYNDDTNYSSMTSYGKLTPFDMKPDMIKLYRSYGDPGYSKEDLGERDKYLYDIYIPIYNSSDDDNRLKYGFTHVITNEEIESLPQDANGDYIVNAGWFNKNVSIEFTKKNLITNLANANTQVGSFHKIQDNVYEFIFSLVGSGYTFTKVSYVNDQYVYGLNERIWPTSYLENSTGCITISPPKVFGGNASLTVLTYIDTLNPDYDITLKELHINEGPDSYQDYLKSYVEEEMASGSPTKPLIDPAKSYYTCDELEKFILIYNPSLTHTSKMNGYDDMRMPKWVRMKFVFNTDLDIRNVEEIYFNGKLLDNKYAISGFSPEGDGDALGEDGEGFSTQGLESGGYELFVYKWIYIGDDEEDTLKIDINADLTLTADDNHKFIFSSSGDLSCTQYDDYFTGWVVPYDYDNIEQTNNPGDNVCKITLNYDNITSLSWDKIKLRVNGGEYMTVPSLYCDKTNMKGKTLGYDENFSGLIIYYRYPGERNPFTITTKKPISKEDLDNGVSDSTVMMENNPATHETIYELSDPFLEEYFDIDFKYYNETAEEIVLYTKDDIHYIMGFMFCYENDYYFRILSATPVVFDGVTLPNKKISVNGDPMEIFRHGTYAAYDCYGDDSFLYMAKEMTLYDPNAPLPSGGGSSSHKSKSLKVIDEKKTSREIKGTVKENNKIIITPKNDRKVKNIILKDSDGNIITTEKNNDGTYSFIMPKKDVYLEIKYKPIELDMTINSRIAHIDDKQVELETEPEIRNDRTMLPIRFVSETLGADVSYDKDKETGVQTVLIKKDNIVIEITIGKNIAKVNGKDYTLDQVAYIKNDFTYLPVRFVSESLRAKVDWDNTNKKVLIEEYLED